MLPAVIIYTRIIVCTVVRLRRTEITTAERVQRWYFEGREAGGGEGEKKLSESAGDLKR